VDALDQWFLEQTSTPVGSILLFILIFLMRVGIDQWWSRRATKKAPKRKRA
jgi:hypothetical protein